MSKEKLASDEKLDKIDFDLFEALAAIDRKDYSYYDKLTAEQQKKFVPFMLLYWVSAVKGNKQLQSYYVQSTDYYANRHIFNEVVQKHSKLQWLMLCAASPGIGKQFHQWIPNIKDSVTKLRENPKVKDMENYYKKVYPKANDSDISLLSKEFVELHKKKVYLNSKFPEMKMTDIDTLSFLITDEDILEYERSFGN